MKRIIIFLTLLGVSYGFATLPAKAGGHDAEENLGNWNLRVGAGMGLGPKIEGSKSTSVGVIPALEFSYRDIVFVTPEGVRAILFETAEDERAEDETWLHYSLSAQIGYDLGRDEDDDKALLLGLGDVKTSVIMSLEAELELGLIGTSLGLTQGAGGHEGTLLDIGVNLPVPLFLIIDNSFMGLNASVTWASADYMQEYYGISGTQAARSPLYDSPYRASSSFYKMDVGLFMGYEISSRWELQMGVNYTLLLEDAAKSPIVKDYGDKDSVGFLMLTTYRFNW